MTLELKPPEDVNSPKAHNRRALGRAVHPAALDRLHELFPDATVTVEHVIYRVPLAPDAPVRMGGPRDRRQHATRVWIDLEGDWQPNQGVSRPSSSIYADASCHPDDNFDRRKGIELAFRRALDVARQRRRAKDYRATVAAASEPTKAALESAS